MQPTTNCDLSLFFDCDDDDCDGIDTSLIDGCGGGEDNYWLYVGSGDSDHSGWPWYCI